MEHYVTLMITVLMLKLQILVKNTKSRCILQCVGLWIASGNCMCQWKLVKVEIDVPETSCDFIPDSDEE